MQHKIVTEKWYEIRFETSNIMLGHKIDTFLIDSPILDECEDIAKEIWSENHMIIRDYEGDFDGIEIYNNEATRPLIEFICQRLQINYHAFRDINFKLVW